MASYCTLWVVLASFFAFKHSRETRYRRRVFSLMRVLNVVCVGESLRECIGLTKIIIH